MKRLLPTLAAAAAFCVAAGAQVNNVDGIVRADRRKLSGCEGPCYDWNDFTEWVKRLDAEHPTV